MPVRIGELLLKEKRITPAQLQEALTYQKTNGGKLGFNLVKLGFVKDEEITALLSKQYGVPSINLTQFEIDPGIIKLIPAETAHKYQIVPLSRAGATLTIAMTDPTNVFAMDDIKFMTGYNVEPVVASETAVLEAITRYYAAPTARARRGEHERRRRRGREPEQRLLARHGHEGARGNDRDRRRRRRGPRGARPDRRRLAREAGRRGADHPAREPDADVRDSEGRERHPHRAVREGVPRPVPHRRHSLQRHGAADEVPRRDHVAPEDHGEARHRREAAAAGRPHQDPVRRQRRRPRRSTSASRACRRSSARRSSCVCSTRTS